MNQYHIYEAIGRGKHSTVYKGRKKKSIEYYAIKSVEKSQKSRVLQEVRTLHSLDHNNVLKFFAWYETSAHLWLVLEYCVGGDLLTLLRQDTQLPEESIHDFARDLVQALQFLHSKGVVYCDLKPSNVLLDEDGRLKLCDFGLARRLSDISKSSVQQLPQAKRGTPCYMAPELFQDGGVHSFGSDLWALGCVMYECFAGRPPFVSKSFTELVNSILFMPTPPLKGCPSKEFEDLVSRLLVKDPTHRIQWRELREHPFWRSKFKVLNLPSQPAYMNFLRLNYKSATTNLDPVSNGDSVSKPSHRTVGDVAGQGNSHVEQVNAKKAEMQNGRHRGQDAGALENMHQRSPPKGEKAVSSVVPLAEGAARTNGGINLLRLSKIVKTNLQREADSEAYRKPVSNSVPDDTDVTIENHDMELNFNEGGESEVTDEDENGNTTTPPHAAGDTGTMDGLHSIVAGVRPEPQQTGRVATVNHPDSNSQGQDDLVRSLELHSSKLESLRLEVAATPPGVGIPRKGQRAAAAALEQEKVSSSHMPRATPAVDKPALPLAHCLWHPSDLAVRPIMTSKRSEKAQDPMFDPRALPVDPLACAEFVKLPQEQIESFLSRIMSSIHGNTVLNEKLNTLKYLETLACNIDAANVLINGPLMPMLVKMLRVTKPPGLRMQLISVMGILIRHATLIEDELGGSGIIAVLTDTLRDKQDKVRRSAMATLGELLFYIATQNDGSPRPGGQESPSKDGRTTSAWQVPSTTIALVGSILQKGEDDLAQHYALKTIENIASQGGDWASRFTNHQVLENLCHIYKAAGKQDTLRATAGSCIVRLVRFTPSTIPVVLEKLTFKDLVSGLAKGTAREQQVNINLLNMALVGSSVIPNMGKYLLALLEEKALIPSIVGILEQGPEVLRGKAFVCAALLCKINRRWLPSLCNAKLLPAVEKLMKDKDQYVQQCAEALVQTIVAVIPGILESISNDIQTLANGKRPGSGTAHGGSPIPRSSARSSIPLFPVVLHLFNSATFRDRLVDEQLLKRFLGYMKYIESSTFQGQDEFQSTLLQIVEVLSQQSPFLLSYPELFINRFLPSLAFLYRKNTDGDMRFLCLKIFFDSLVLFLDDLSVAGAVQLSQSELADKEGRKEQIESVIKQQFLPIYSSLVADEDPIPMYAQKLLVMLLDAKCIKTSDILQLKLVSQFFDFLREDLVGINLHDVRLCLFLACAPEVETKVLSELRVVGRLGALLDFVHAKGMEDFLEPVLCVCRVLLLRNSGKGGKAKSSSMANGAGAAEANGVEEGSYIQDMSDLGRYAGIFVELSGSYDPRIAETASESLVLLMRTVPKAAKGYVLSNMAQIAHALEVSANCHGHNVLSYLQRRLLFAVSVACREHRLSLTNNQSSSPLARNSDFLALENTLVGLRSSPLPQVADAAAAAVLELQLLSR